MHGYLLLLLLANRYAGAATSKLSATFYPTTEFGENGAEVFGQLGVVNSTEMRQWVDALQRFEDSAAGHVNYVTNSCTVASQCTKAVKVRTRSLFAKRAPFFFPLYRETSLPSLAVACFGVGPQRSQ